MEIISPPKLLETIPKLSYDQSETTLTNCRHTIQSHLFLAFLTLWLYKAKVVNALRPEKEKLKPDFWIPKTDPIYIKYNNNEEYFLPLRNLKIYGFREAEYKFNADICLEQKHALIENQYKRQQEELRVDKVWRFNLAILAPSIYGEADFELYDKSHEMPYTDLGKFRFEFRNAIITTQINVPQIDPRFVDPEPGSTKFRYPDVQLKINYGSFSINIENFPTKSNPFYFNGQLITPVSNERKGEIIQDFMNDKLENGKAEISERLKIEILEKIKPMVEKVQTRLDLFDAFYVGMNIEPFYSQFSHKFIPPPPPPEPSRFLET